MAIERAFYEMGISSDDMMAIGDAKNDVAMLKYVKYGIAMGNAIDELKEVTYEVSQTTTALLNLSINTSHN